MELLVKMDIVYEDKDKIILNKPAGQLSQSGKSFEMDLVSEVLTYRKSKGEEAYAAIINRLDRPVSGLVLMAKNKKEAARLSLLMQKETLCKHYQVLVCGKPDSDEGELVDNLIKDAKNNESSVVSKGTAGSKEARLKYRLEQMKAKHIEEDKAEEEAERLDEEEKQKNKELKKAAAAEKKEQKKQAGEAKKAQKANKPKKVKPLSLIHI